MKQLWTMIGAAAFAVSLAGCGSDQAGNGNAGEHPGDSQATTGAGEHPGDSHASAGAGEHPGDSQAKTGAAAGTASGAGSASAGQKAAVNLAATEGNNVSGNLNLTQAAGGVQLQGTITGLTPGEHGFHVHENGDCSAPDGTSAGGHFDPEGDEHGAPDASEHHTGDMGNITADDSGTVELNESFEFLSLSGPNSIVGKAIIVHGGKDDLSSQPSGDAGDRVACGVIKSAAKSGGAGSLGGGTAGGNAQGGGASPTN